MVRFLTLLYLSSTAWALYREDAGVLDFTIATAGHGRVQFVAPIGVLDDWILTSDAGSHLLEESSCYIAVRSLTDGSLVWREKVCAESGHGVAASASGIFTIDGIGVLRGWSHTGEVLWDVKVPGATVVWAEDDWVAVASSSGNRVFSASTGEVFDAKISSKPNKKLGSSEASCRDVSMSSKGISSSVSWETDVPFLEDASFYTAACTDDAAYFLVSGSRSLTSLVKVADSASTLWTAHEDLAHISSALLVDASHIVPGGEDGQVLDLAARLQSQVESIMNMFTESSSHHRDNLFGFVKTAVLLTGTAIHGMDTTGDNRAQVKYSIDLPLDAVSHKLVYGGANAKEISNGIHGPFHFADVLSLSMYPSKVEWTCFEGNTGETRRSASLSLASPVAQIVPFTRSSGCDQAALLLLQDGSMAVVPEDAVDDAKALAAGSLHAHVLEESSLEARSITADLTSMTVGSVSFPGETVVATAYPSRDDIAHMPCSVLGDESLLLKYINPHIAVVMTAGTANAVDPLVKSSRKKDGKRKPTGAGDSTVDSGDENVPNLFVNVVDTVSGRVLHRVSHANALLSPKPSIVISENWVYYTFANERTRRSELGVLSLYEGMIDSKGLTAFSSPEQSETFSSLDARDSKPVVLAKSFSLKTPVTALGVTSTREGISARKLVLAGTDGRIVAVDRKMIEPRRPVGQLKDYEKKEKLVQYTELVPVISYMALSYDKTVEGVSQIVTSPTHLESQTLLFAFGGPDIFFARTSPSRGFDLLPDTFNRSMLAVTVIGLLAVLVVLQNMAAKKTRNLGWM